MHVSSTAPLTFLPALDTALAVLQSSSPSYLLLASLDAGRAAAFEGGGAGWDGPLAAAAGVRGVVEAAAARGVRLLPGCADPLRITFAVDSLLTPGAAACCGLGVAEALEAAGAVPEAALPGGAVVLACGAGSGPRAVARFAAALAAVLGARDAGALPMAPREGAGDAGVGEEPCCHAPTLLSPADALFGGRPVEAVPLSAAPGRVAAAALTPYPPGIPAVLPGEVISESVACTLQATLARGGRVTGAADGRARVFFVE